MNIDSQNTELIKLNEKFPNKVRKLTSSQQLSTSNRQLFLSLSS